MSGNRRPLTIARWAKLLADAVLHDISLMQSAIVEFGAGLTSGQAMTSPRLRSLLSLGDGDQAVCCINVGSATRARPGRLRPMPASFVSTL